MDNALTAFGFVIGSWTVESETFPEAYGSAAGKSTARVESVWGTDRAWIETEFTAALPSGQKYAVHIIVASKPGSADLTSFAVNTMSRAGVVYEGRVVTPDQVEFIGQTGQKCQRIAYRRQDENHVEFRVEDAPSSAGPWSRHSRALWRKEA